MDPSERWIWAGIIFALLSALGYIVRQYINGKIIARQQLLDARQTYLDALAIQSERLVDKEAQLHTLQALCDEITGTLRTETATNSTLARQLDVSMEATRTIERFLTAFPAGLAGGGTDGRAADSDS